jgi:16S rRNA (cytosine967-C5)-methyltransferase
MTAPARKAAFRALREIDRQPIDLASALAAARQSLTDERDQALTAEIVTGTLRWRAALDNIVEQVATRTIAALDPDVLTVLRLSLYQILHLDRVPASAVVDDAVDLVRAARKVSAAGFVNAILRTTLRRKEELSLPPRPLDVSDRTAVLDYLGVTHSHPRWLVSRWLDRHGFDAAEAWVRFNNTQAALTLRANRLRTTRTDLATALLERGVETEPTRWAPDGLTVTGGTPLRGAGGDGLLLQRYLIQDEASQLVAVVVGAQAGERILDVCAAPGGKTTALAAAVGDAGGVTACDARRARVALLAETVRRSGAANVRIIRADARGGLPVQPVFDRVLVDAPCSGLGTLRRDPDIKWRRDASDLPALAHEQRAILRQAMGAVRPGGRLVYATCSSEPEENEEVVDAVLALEPRFRMVHLGREDSPDIPAALFPASLRPFVDERGAFRTLPFRDGLEAFYAAVIVAV